MSTIFVASRNYSHVPDVFPSSAEGNNVVKKWEVGSDSGGSTWSGEREFRRVALTGATDDRLMAVRCCCIAC